MAAIFGSAFPLEMLVSIEQSPECSGLIKVKDPWNDRGAGGSQKNYTV